MRRTVNEKCWCGKELEKEKCLNEDGEEIYSGLLVCPTHHENWQWRECLFAGAIAGHYRWCNVHEPSASSVAAVAVHVCAACPVPLLVETVRAVSSFRENEACALLTTSKDNQCENCRFVGVCKVRAALAALPKEPTSD